MRSEFLVRALALPMAFGLVLTVAACDSGSAPGTPTQTPVQDETPDKTQKAAKPSEPEEPDLPVLK